MTFTVVVILCLAILATTTLAGIAWSLWQRVRELEAEKEATAAAVVSAIEAVVPRCLAAFEQMGREL